MSITMKQKIMRTSVARPLAVLMAALWSACAPHQPRSEAPDLSGRWMAEFQLRSGAHMASGIVTLHTAPADLSLCPEREIECASQVKGSHEINFEPLLGRAVPIDVVAGVVQNRQIIFLLGKCCDQGEISARGELRNGTIRGRWIETFLGGGREGTFTITRAPEP